MKQSILIFGTAKLIGLIFFLKKSYRPYKIDNFYLGKKSIITKIRKKIANNLIFNEVETNLKKIKKYLYKFKSFELPSHC
jgi:hypothetical protein